MIADHDKEEAPPELFFIYLITIIVIAFSRHDDLHFCHWKTYLTLPGAVLAKN